MVARVLPDKLQVVTAEDDDDDDAGIIGNLSEPIVELLLVAAVLVVFNVNF